MRVRVGPVRDLLQAGWGQSRLNSLPCCRLLVMQLGLFVQLGVAEDSQNEPCTPWLGSGAAASDLLACPGNSSWRLSNLLHIC